MRPAQWGPECVCVWGVVGGGALASSGFSRGERGRRPVSRGCSRTVAEFSLGSSGPGPKASHGCVPHRGPHRARRGQTGLAPQVKVTSQPLMFEHVNVSVLRSLGQTA